jgi:hypothetical protein
MTESRMGRRIEKSLTVPERGWEKSCLSTRDSGMVDEVKEEKGGGKRKDLRRLSFQLCSHEQY